MRHLYLVLICFFIALPVKSQEKTNIKVIVPHPDDDVYIVGNQTDLGDWNPSKVKMYKVSDYVRMISIPFYFPAEFMFTRGTWASEGIIYELDNNPNIYLKEYVKEKVFKIKGWKDELLKAKFTTNYKNEPFESRILNDKRKLKIYLPKDYSVEKRYPVFYVPDLGQMFKTASNYLDIWADQNYKDFPDFILVGIPFKHEEITNIQYNQKNASRLQDYIIYDVVPFINGQFSTSGFNIISGQNFMADFNHGFLLDENSPFTAYISLNPDKSSEDLTHLNYSTFYENTKLFYFLGQTKDVSMTGNKVTPKVKTILKNHLKAKIKIYQTNADNVFIVSIYEALSFIFDNYQNPRAYKDFNEYLFNYEKDMMQIYKMEAEYHKKDILYFLDGILKTQDIQNYNSLLGFMQNKQIKDDDGKKFEFDQIDVAIHHYNLGMYDRCIQIFENELIQAKTKNVSRDEREKICSNLEYALLSFGRIGKEKAIFEFLDTAKEVFPVFILESYYLMAKYAHLYNVLISKGKGALEFCYDNYRPNDVFTIEDLNKINFE